MAAATSAAIIGHSRPPKFARAMGAFFVPRLLRSPLHRLLDRKLMLLEYTGRKSGRHYTLPVGRHELDGRLCVLTAQGWPRNFKKGGALEVTVDGRRHRAAVVVVTDPDEVARLHLQCIEDLGWRSAQRSLRLSFPEHRVPHLDALRDAVERYGLTVVYLDPLEAGAS